MTLSLSTLLHFGILQNLYFDSCDFAHKNKRSKAEKMSSATLYNSVIWTVFLSGAGYTTLKYHKVLHQKKYL